MAFDPNFLEFMPLSVAVTRATGTYDDYGKPIMAATSVQYRARSEVGTKRVVTSAGKEIVSTMRVFLACQEILNPEDAVTLPAGLNDQNKPLQGIDPVYDEEGLHHVVLLY